MHACYAISAAAGIIPLCIPYLAGCTSISASGRHGVAYLLFKAGMIPAAMSMAFYWWLARDWLAQLACPAGAAMRAMVALGITSAVFLVLYTSFLGSKGDCYDLMRRYGVTVHLSFGVLAQILMTRALLHAPRAVLPRWIPRAKLALVATLLALGLVSIPMDYLVADEDRVLNAIEWNFGGLMSLFYLLTWRAARASRPTG